MSENLLTHLRQRYHETNLDQTVDQVVAMIFRVIPNGQIQLLFLQRAYSEHDHYSGDICFPGGYREKGENCLSTAIRQTDEEISLKLTKQHYLGALQFTFTTRFGKSRVRGNKNQTILLRMGILMFQIDYEMSKNIRITQKEIRDFKWINLRYFFEGDAKNFTFQNFPQRESFVFFPALMIGMDRNLYGLTFYTLTLFVVNVYQLKEMKPNIKSKIDKKFYELLRFHSTNIQVEGTQEDLKIAKKLYLENRVGFLQPKAKL